MPIDFTKITIFKPCSFLVKQDDLITLMQEITGYPGAIRFSIEKNNGETPSLAQIFQMRQNNKQLISPNEQYHQLVLFQHFLRELTAALKYNILKNTSVAFRMRVELANLLKENRALIQPAAIVRLVDCLPTETGLALAGGTYELHGKSLHRFVNKSDPVKPKPIFIFIVTIGSAIDKRIADLNYTEGDAYQAFLLNGLAAALVETATSDLQQYLEKSSSWLSPSQTLRRVSPGFRDWPLTDQKVIFEILKPSENIGVTLSADCLMQPLKSTSGIMGVIENAL
ncbi:MAG TPA: vitamin B12 dependent-methionine synthase activation domain-containing protein [Candidatus Marinimicrobia bacterium]|nr:MAG: Vitamin B12 dependent methionine synthase, activation domain [Candidatus Marinimicrobia bacterium ADurb.Bin030]HOO13829.1 vitamin B12 dependent-methionine synthase activation domain-containing protein [Candidatus Neomarinimicrobiota bacterium]HPI26877.1 vitamin B12 dependent-methionine synthase activation domain-containing protein [Candidatus Neomarinimicrobiota bacterium]HPN73691.1 vitamin B12 dependent-methionine synthase activation domain-containing protein [Candidatus Neomarinimicrob